MTRADDVERLYVALTLFARRAREMNSDLHPDVGLAAYTLLSHVEAHPGVRAADLAATWGLDKSTVSRQLGQLVAADLLTRAGERPGRRGQVLELTAGGRSALARAAASVHALMVERLDGWADADVAAFAILVARFNGEGDGAGATSG